MSSPATILGDLRAHGAHVSLAGNRVRIEAPRGLLTPELVECARQHRDELLGLLRRERNPDPPVPAIADDEVSEARQRLGAVLIRSNRFGEVWLALDPCMAPDLEAEESGRSEPRPVLLAEDLTRLHGRSDEAIAASLEVLRAFPGARIRS